MFFLISRRNYVKDLSSSGCFYIDIYRGAWGEILQAYSTENAIVTLFAVATLGKKCTNHAFQVKQMLCAQYVHDTIVKYNICDIMYMK